MAVAMMAKEPYSATLAPTCPWGCSTPVGRVQMRNARAIATDRGRHGDEDGRSHAEDHGRDEREPQASYHATTTATTRTPMMISVFPT